MLREMLPCTEAVTGSISVLTIGNGPCVVNIYLHH